jgi:hypothetical protein
LWINLQDLSIDGFGVAQAARSMVRKRTLQWFTAGRHARRPSRKKPNNSAVARRGTPKFERSRRSIQDTS